MPNETYLVTSESLPVPSGRVNNLWYDRTSSDVVYVFLHGIFSTSRTCWLYEDRESAQSVFWPDLVRKDDRLGHPSIYLAGYHTALDAGDFSVAQCAREVLEALESTDADGTLPVLDSPVLVFICHSTGGIVARYMIERNQDAFHNKAVGLALIASPSLGSVWANVATFAARYYNQTLGLQLRWRGETLQDIDGRFRDLVDQRPFKMPRLFGMEACENQMVFRKKIPAVFRWLVPPRFKVVTTLSAGQYFGEVKVLRGTDHFSSVKPDSLDNPAHQFLVTFEMKFRRYREEVPLGFDFSRRARARADNQAITEDESGRKSPAGSVPANLLGDAASPPTSVVHQGYRDDRSRRLISYYTNVFVGRASAIDQIRSLAQSRKAGYLHVRGSGGSGKSALVANLIDRFNRTPPVNGAPVLLSYFIRQGQTDTRSLLQSLISQIMNSLGMQESLETDVSLLETHFNNLWQQLIDGAGQRRPVLLLIDGLDELTERASIGAWLPGNLVEYVHVVVTSRPGFELGSVLPRERHIATQAVALDLPNLSVTELVDLLTEYLRDPRRARQLAPEIERITKGLPLTASLLSGAVAKDGERALDRDRLSTLIEDYLDEDAEQLTKAGAGSLERRVTAVLASARGPLVLSDLCDVLGAEKDAVEQALRSVMRYLLPTSLEFGHPEMKAAVARHLGKDEKAAASQALSHWVKSCAEQKTPTIPEYVLNHFVDQMIDERADDVLFRTVFGGAWREARHRQARLYLEYANDLTKARDYAAVADPKWMPLCQSCFLLAQLRTVATSIASSVIVLLAKLGDLVAAESYVALDSDIPGKCWMLTTLGRMHQEAGDDRKARETFARAVTELYRVTEHEKRCTLLRILAQRYSALGDLEKAGELASHCRATVRLIADGWKRREPTRDAVDALIAAKNFEAAIDVAMTEEDDYRSEELMERLAVPFAASRHLDLLLGGLARHSVGGPWVFGRVVHALAAGGHLVEATRVASSAPDRDEALVHACGGLAERRDPEACFETLHAIGTPAGGADESRRAGSLVDNLKQFFGAGGSVSTDRPKYSMMAQFRRRDAVKEILKNLPEDLDKNRTAFVARSVESIIDGLADLDTFEDREGLVQWLVKRGAGAEAADLAGRIAKAAVTIEKKPAGARGYAAAALRAVKAWDESIAVIQPVLQADFSATTDLRDVARNHMCEALIGAGRLDEALAVSGAIESPAWRAITLGAIAAVLPEKGEPRPDEQPARCALELATGLAAPEAETVLSALAYDYAEAGRTRRALEAARTIAGNDKRDKALSTLAYILADVGKVADAREAASSMADYSKRQNRLSALTRQLLHKADYEGALTSVGWIEATYQRGIALAACADVILPASTPYERSAWIERLLRDARSLDGFARLDAFGGIGQAVFASGDRQRARAIVDEALETAHGASPISHKVYAGFARVLRIAATPKKRST